MGSRARSGPRKSPGSFPRSRAADQYGLRRRAVAHAAGPCLDEGKGCERTASQRSSAPGTPSVMPRYLCSAGNEVIQDEEAPSSEHAGHLEAGSGLCEIRAEAQRGSLPLPPPEGEQWRAQRGTADHLASMLGNPRP